MAWTAPRTWVSGELVSASLMNTHVRDDMLETAPAKVTTKGDSVWGTGANAIARLPVGSNSQVLVADSSASQGVSWTTQIGFNESSRDLTLGDGTGTIWEFIFDTAAESQRQIVWQTNGSARWVVGTPSSPAESGGNAGSDFAIVSRTDIGAVLRTNLFIERSGGLVCVNDNANANMVAGVTIQQEDADNEILALKSSDVAHSFTSETETDTFGRFQKQVSSEGGLIIDGFTEGSSGGLVLAANNGAGIATKGNSSLGGVIVASFLISGSARGSHNANENLFVIRDNATTVWIVDKEGDTHRDGTDNTFDDHDDVQLIRALDHALSPAKIIRNEFDAFLKYNRGDLIKAGILSQGNFINESQLLRLHSGAFWQMSEKISRLESRLDNAMALLGAGG